MIRIFLPPDQLTSNRVTISGDQARHLFVLRVRTGETINIFDGSGYRYECKIISAHKKEFFAEITRKEPYSAESPVSIILAQSLPKGDKMDFITEKATELGVRSIVPLITERSQVRHTEKLERWRKIAMSASQQCGRDRIPEILEPLGFLDYLIKISPILKVKDNDQSVAGLIFSEEKKDGNLKAVLSGFKNARHVILLIGPEGGFSKEECNSALRHGFIDVSLGPRILRTETAPITALSIIQYELGDMT